jgi:hypothetical protein
VVVVTSQYHPEAWGALGRIFAKIYASTGSPVKVLEGFLALSTRNSFNAAIEGVPVFNSSDYNVKSCYLAGSIVVSDGNDIKC